MRAVGQVWSIGRVERGTGLVILVMEGRPAPPTPSLHPPPPPGAPGYSSDGGLLILIIIYFLIVFINIIISVLLVFVLHPVLLSVLLKRSTPDCDQIKDDAPHFTKPKKTKKISKYIFIMTRQAIINTDII